MKRFIDINELFTRLQNDKINKVNTILDKFTFVHIFALWVFIVAGFGGFFHLLQDDQSYLYSTVAQEPITSLFDAIYFSFITATSTGFGDIIPFGIYKVFSIIEVVFGLVLLAFVTSKFVYLKQDIILREIYDISFQEKINRVRSSLLLFRQNLNKLIHAVDDHTIRKRDIDDIYITISSFDDILQEVSMLIYRGGDTHFTKSIDPISAELIFNSIIVSLQKLEELIRFLQQRKVDWRREVTLTTIKKCLEVTTELFHKLAISKRVPEKVRKHLTLEGERLVEEIRSGLERKV